MIGNLGKWLLGLGREAWAGWNRFWFEADGAAQMRVFRVAFGLLLFGAYLIRTLDLEFYYSEGGLLNSALLPDVFPTAFRPSLFLIFPGNGFLWTANTIFLVSLLTLAFGVYPRISAVIASIIHISFLHRNMGVHFGADTMATYFLLYLCFADYRERYKDAVAVLGSAAFRLCQIQLCVIYAYSGLQKLRGVLWWRGEGVWSVLANSQMARWDFSWMAHFPLTLTAMSYLSLFWEIYFPLLIWVKPLRYPLLVFGVLFHLGIAVSISIPFFGLIMIVFYLLFLDAAHAKGLERGLKKYLFFNQVPAQIADRFIV
jgi:hypothetical protein